MPARKKSKWSCFVTIFIFILVGMAVFLGWIYIELKSYNAKPLEELISEWINFFNTNKEAILKDLKSYLTDFASQIALNAEALDASSFVASASLVNSIFAAAYTAFFDHSDTYRAGLKLKDHTRYSHIIFVIRAFRLLSIILVGSSLYLVMTNKHVSAAMFSVVNFGITFSVVLISFVLDKEEYWEDSTVKEFVNHTDSSNRWLTKMRAVIDGIDLRSESDRKRLFDILFQTHTEIERMWNIDSARNNATREELLRNLFVSIIEVTQKTIKQGCSVEFFDSFANYFKRGISQKGSFHDSVCFLFICIIQTQKGKENYGILNLFQNKAYDTEIMSIIESLLQFQSILNSVEELEMDAKGMSGKIQDLIKKRQYGYLITACSNLSKNGMLSIVVEETTA